jgi:hypothetical protein
MFCVRADLPKWRVATAFHHTCRTYDIFFSRLLENYLCGDRACCFVNERPLRANSRRSPIERYGTPRLIRRAQWKPNCHRESGWNVPRLHLGAGQVTRAGSGCYLGIEVDDALATAEQVDV